MLIIILGILLCLAIIWVDIHFEVGSDYIIEICCVILLAAIAIGLFVPIKGMEDKAKLISETELVSLNNTVTSEGAGILLYVSVNASNVYSYRYEVENEFGNGKSYKVGTVSSNVTEVEEPNCEVPVLKKYERKAEKSIWSFALYTETEYVFVVPEGTVGHDIKLN